jgi:phosphatidylinositol alpha-mannosyltransferase
VSEPTAQFADTIYGTSSIVIPNAVDTKRYVTTKRTTKNPDKKTLVFLGRFDQRKGPLYLIEALAELLRSGFSLHTVDVIMGGKGPDLSQCRRRAQELGLEISFPGFVDEDKKPAFLASADVTVFPSTGGEAFGISVVEAMASGASIVLAGDNSGYRSILGQKPELLFDPHDTKVFARTLAHYLTLDAAEAKKKKEWLKQKAATYDTALVCDSLLRLYARE